MLGDYDWKLAQDLARSDLPVTALVVAAMLRSDTENLRALSHAFPMLAIQVRQRTNSTPQPNRQAGE